MSGGRKFSAANTGDTEDNGKDEIIMKKLAAIILTLILVLSLCACGKDDGLGKQTSVNKDEGYTIVNEVLPFEYKKIKNELKENKNAKLSGFVTNEENKAGDITSKNDALEIAKKEVTDSFNKINVAYDRTRGIWRVTFSTDTVTEEKTENTVVMTVYVDEEGYTIATVKGE